MVPEKDDHGGLVLLAVVADELPQGVVALPGQGEVLPGGAVGARQPVGQVDGGLQVVPPLGVAAVVLHGHVEEEGVPLLLPGGPEDHLIVGPVGHVVADVVGVHHVLLVHLAVEVQIVIGQHPVPPAGLVGVEGGGLIALAPRHGGQGGHPLLHVQLIGHRVRGLEQAGEAGEVLELHRGRPAPGDRGVHPALHRVLLQGVEEGGGVLAGLEVVEDGEIGKGLVHDDDEVGGLPVRVPLQGGVLLHQLQHLVVGVVRRLLHRAVPQGHGEVQQKAVALGDPLLGVDAQGGEGPGAEEGEAIAQHRAPGHQGKGEGDPGPLPLGRADQHQEQIGRQQHRRLHDVGVHGVVEAVGHVGGGAPGGHVGGEQDAPPEPEHIVVYQPHQEGQADPQGAGPADAAQHQPQHGEQDVVPDHVHQHLPGVQVGEHVVLVEGLHHPQADPGSQQEHQPGPPFSGLLPHVPEQAGEQRAVTGQVHSRSSQSPRPRRGPSPCPVPALEGRAREGKYPLAYSFDRKKQDVPGELLKNFC